MPNDRQMACMEQTYTILGNITGLDAEACMAQLVAQAKGEVMTLLAEPGASTHPPSDAVIQNFTLLLGLRAVGTASVGAVNILAAQFIRAIQLSEADAFALSQRFSGSTPVENLLSGYDSMPGETGSAACAQRLLSVFYSLYPTLTRDFELEFPDRVIFQWHSAMLKVRPMRALPKFESNVNANDTYQEDQNEQVLSSAVSATTGTQMSIIARTAKTAPLARVSAPLLNIFFTKMVLSLVAAGTFVIAPGDRAGDAGFIGKERYFATMRAGNQLLQRMQCALKTLKSIFRLQPLIVAIFAYLNAQLIASGSKHFDSIVKQLCEDNQFWTGVEHPRENRKNPYQGQNQQNRNGRVPKGGIQKGSPNARSPNGQGTNKDGRACVHFFKNGACTKGTACGFRHDGIPPSKEAMDAYFSDKPRVQRGAPRAAVAAGEEPDVM